MTKPHILALPFPAQGHVIPLLELSQRLVNQGFTVTFVNTDYNHIRVLNSMSETRCLGDGIRLVSIPDGMEEWEDRNDLARLVEAAETVMSKKLEELVSKINESGSEKISCVIADESLGWGLEIADRMKLGRVAFWPASAAVLALVFSVGELQRDGIIDQNGFVIENKTFAMAPEMPAMKTKNFVWLCIGDDATTKIIFNTVTKNNTAVKSADWILCNSCYDIEPSAFSLVPKIHPIGPMFSSNRTGNHSDANFWETDTTCLDWLDQQPPSSVIYVAFGSFAVFDQTQFSELALGLELSNRPFLWVVREDNGTESKAYPEGFLERMKGLNGKIVSWSPQQIVLSHRSIACFVSHCGWNSTLEGLSNGVPFLCWPYFADQFANESYLCDVWRIGVRFEKDESGIIRRGEVKRKIDMLIGEEGFRVRALKLKELAINSVMEGGKSDVVFKNFVEWVKIRSLKCA